MNSTIQELRAEIDALLTKPEVQEDEVIAAHTGEKTVQDRVRALIDAVERDLTAAYSEIAALRRECQQCRFEYDELLNDYASLRAAIEATRRQ